MKIYILIIAVLFSSPLFAGGGGTSISNSFRSQGMEMFPIAFEDSFVNVDGEVFYIGDDTLENEIFHREDFENPDLYEEGIRWE